MFNALIYLARSKFMSERYEDMLQPFELGLRKMRPFSKKVAHPCSASCTYSN